MIIFIFLLLLLTTFEVSVIFWSSYGNIENWLESETKPLLPSSACPNNLNAVYLFGTSVIILCSIGVSKKNIIFL